MIKIDKHKIEYFLLHFFIALQDEVIDECGVHFLANRGVRAVDLARIVKEYPDAFLPEFRKKRSYLSSNLSKHEILSENPYNKKLFKRLYRGYYELNPDLAVWANDRWMNVYDMMQSEEVRVPTREERDEFIKEYYKRLREENKRLRDKDHWDQGWYDDDEYDERFGGNENDDDEYDDGEYDKDVVADPSGDGDDQKEKIWREPPELNPQEETDQKRADRETPTQFRLPFDD